MKIEIDLTQYVTALTDLEQQYYDSILQISAQKPHDEDYWKLLKDKAVGDVAKAYWQRLDDITAKNDPSGKVLNYWRKAKYIVHKRYGKSRKDDTYYQEVVRVYKKLIWFDPNRGMFDHDPNKL